MRTIISNYTVEVLRSQLFHTLEVAHAIKVHVLTIELWTHITSIQCLRWMGGLCWEGHKWSIC